MKPEQAPAQELRDGRLAADRALQEYKRQGPKNTQGGHGLEKPLRVEIGPIQCSWSKPVQHRTKSDRARSMSYHFWLLSAEYRPNLAEHDPLAAEIGPSWAKSGQFWPTSVKFGPTFPEFGPRLAKIIRFRARSSAKLVGRGGVPTSVENGSSSVELWPDFDRLDRIGPEFG